MHKLLQRQLKRCVAGLSPTASEWALFLQTINDAYEQGEADRALLERSLELSSQELLQINDDLRRDMAKQEQMQKSVLQSEKMAAIGQLASGVAHEINNPLGVILGFSQAAIRRLTVGDPLDGPLKSIEREAIRCKNLVQDLLTFSRISKIERELLDLNRVIDGALSLIMAQARIHNIRIQRELSADLPPFFGNSNQIQQIIVNLANNAFDAMGDQGVFTVRTSILQEESHAWICLEAMDTGPGIPAEIMPRIFEPFFTTKSIGKGTGLGLSLVHEIVQKHFGVIDIKSQPGCTEFCIRFPVQDPVRLPV